MKCYFIIKKVYTKGTYEMKRYATIVVRNCKEVSCVERDNTHERSECLGCALANKEEFVHVVYENELVCCFLGHCPITQHGLER